MDFVLTGIGLFLDRPLDERLPNATATTAHRRARRMLAANPVCDAVEIFSAGRFVAEIRRDTEAARGAGSHRSFEPVD